MDGSFLVVNICACARMLLLYISSLPEAPLDSRFFFLHSTSFMTRIRHGLLSHCITSLTYLASTDIFNPFDR